MVYSTALDYLFMFVIIFMQLIFAHDTSRVVQCLYKHGLPEHRMAIFEELRGKQIYIWKMFLRNVLT